MTRPPLRKPYRLVLTLSLVGAVACSSNNPTADADLAAAKRDNTILGFQQGVAGDASCDFLFGLRNDLEPHDPYIDSMNADLRMIGCYSSSTERTEPTTTTLPIKAYDQLGFKDFLDSALAGTSYSDISIAVLEYAAEFICQGLAAGTSESAMRAEIADSERMGDPNLDRDIPAYVDAIFLAATTYVCPPG